MFRVLELVCLLTIDMVLGMAYLAEDFYVKLCTCLTLAAMLEMPTMQALLAVLVSQKCGRSVPRLPPTMLRACVQLLPR